MFISRWDFLESVKELLLDDFLNYSGTVDRVLLIFRELEVLWSWDIDN